MKLSERIIFANAAVICVHKMAGELSVPDRDHHHKSQKPSEVVRRPVLGLLLQEYLGQQIFPVHRLDLPVSGLLLFAKTAAAHRDLNLAFENGEIHKTYLAQSQVQNFDHWPMSVANPREKILSLNDEHFQWRNQILRGKRRAFQSAAGQKTLTMAHCFDAVVDPDGGSRLHWRLHPVTGRSHQLRFEMSYRGFPVLGDKLYGGAAVSDYSEGEIALQHHSLNFGHVKTAKKLGLPDLISL